MVARADALALYLMSAVSVLADAEVKMAVIESDEEQSRLSLQRYQAVLKACAASGQDPGARKLSRRLTEPRPPVCNSARRLTRWPSKISHLIPI